MSSCHTRALALAAALTLSPAAFAWPAQEVPAPAAQGAGQVHLWHAAARDAIARTRPNQQAALRLLAYLSLAQHETAQQMPAGSDEGAWSAAFDRVSADVLSGLMPSQAGVWQGLIASLEAARAGDPRPAEASATAASVARRVLERAAADGFDAAWTGRVPESPAAWKSQLQPARAPHLPQLGEMKTVWLANAAAIRVAPPPGASTAFDTALAEVRTRSGSGDAASLARAKRWEMTGGSLVAGFWDETALELARRDGLPGPQAARAAALALGATMDANIVCHRVKYTHWVPRPSQADPSIRPLVGLPNHPSYPSNHSCDSTAAAAVLGQLFPRHRAALDAMAREAGESRIDGGIHYRFDVEAGEAIGRAAAAAALRSGGTSVAVQP